ncbi:MAG: sugar transferase [Bacteroidota bacterium]
MSQLTAAGESIAPAPEQIILGALEESIVHAPDHPRREMAAAEETLLGQVVAFPMADPWAGRTVELAIKRAMDILGSLVGFVLLSPVFIVAAVMVKLTSPGPILYRQERVGRGNKVFTLYKFRTMVQDAEKDGPKWAEPDDDRVTWCGRFFRQTRIDELPQLWNILRGEMSLVGPRPERKCFVNEFIKEEPRFAWRVAVKPGLTGWAQINGGYDLKPSEKLAYDLHYIENHSLLIDLRIILRTVGVVLRRDGAR